jgi:hypothetical protein
VRSSGKSCFEELSGGSSSRLSQYDDLRSGVDSLGPRLSGGSGKFSEGSVVKLIQFDPHDR